MNRSTTLFWRQDSSTAIYMLSVSKDGYIRLSFTKFKTISLIHLISGLDENTPTIIHTGAIPTEITGYTEWINTTAPTITIGWDWQINTDRHQILLRRISEPRSNIMLLDSTGIDVKPIESMLMLGSCIDVINWQDEVLGHIDIRYGK